MENNNTIFATLADTNVNAHVDKKKTGQTELSYLSWAWAWDYFKRAMPDAKYEIRHWGDKPYLFDEQLGYMVETSITAGGETHVMWLPVMDSTNHAMRNMPYTVKTKYSEITVPAATMFDINKTIMRCLVKNMAMFGLGLYIYAGEDLPGESDEEVVAPSKPSVDDIINGMSKMTLANLKACYARAIEIYPKDTPEYKKWISAWVAKKDELEMAQNKAEIDADAKFVNNIQDYAV